MKFITIFISFLSLFTSQAFAHTDHALGEGSLHTFYHVTFWAVFALVVYKAYTYFKKKKSEKS
ncbi:hypothetical protein [Colwellia echini]|uniref:Uncharacterized protein n=1 Tax=Colwellia echini TaxID=1982103 RepID=A0ABY3MTU4_9GAMM|nr:hypothetical protein [Colwellia echini]TYK64622.1 hypothetical protein CWS31_014860 [Colwellia echini]